MGLKHHLPFHTPVQIVAILKIITIKGKKDNDLFISIVNKLEHKYTKFHVMSSVVQVFPQGKATNWNSGTRFSSIRESVFMILYIFIYV